MVMTLMTVFCYSVKAKFALHVTNRDKRIFASPSKLLQFFFNAFSRIKKYLKPKFHTMNSASTIVFKKNSREAAKLEKRSRPIHTAEFVAICLWTLSAIANATTAEISPNATGVSLSMTIQDVLVMIISTWMLTRGLYNSNQFLVIPWLVISTWSIYNCQYKGIVKMANILHHTRLYTKVPWIALTLNVFGLVLRAMLILRVAQLSIFQWYHKKLEKELLLKL